MKAFISGICGFTGRYLAQELAEQGYAVFGLAQAPHDVVGAAHIYCGDLLDANLLRRILNEVRPDVVVHLAGISFVAHDNVEDIYRTNVLGTRCLLDAMASQNINWSSVLLASSANVYGNAIAGVLTEETPPAPANDYAVSKLTMEYVAKLYQDRLPIVLARPFNYTGVGQAESFLIPKIVSHVQRHAPMIELGNLDVARDFSDVRSVVQYYRRLLECGAAIGQTFNVCSGRAHTLHEILAMVRSISGHDMEVRVNPSFVRVDEIKQLVGSRAKLEHAVGQVPDIPLVDTVRWMIEAERKSSR